MFSYLLCRRMRGWWGLRIQQHAGQPLFMVLEVLMLSWSLGRSQQSGDSAALPEEGAAHCVRGRIVHRGMEEGESVVGWDMDGWWQEGCIDGWIWERVIEDKWVCLCVCLSESVSGWMNAQTDDGWNIQEGEAPIAPRPPLSILWSHKFCNVSPCDKWTESRGWLIEWETVQAARPGHDS